SEVDFMAADGAPISLIFLCRVHGNAGASGKGHAGREGLSDLINPGHLFGTPISFSYYKIIRIKALKASNFILI
ncbi:MAG: hypothetical protein IIT33_01425, partial [Prevotella sp.]|nr:hypothetical protein [Prevotella sp.]